MISRELLLDYDKEKILSPLFRGDEIVLKLNLDRKISDSYDKMIVNIFNPTGAITVFNSNVAEGKVLINLSNLNEIGEYIVRCWLKSEDSQLYYCTLKFEIKELIG